ncbi:hypothetical protein [Staphylococcus americanisciuri]|uniref:Uncharacterized protein n=1 Tax=Staphylococcus americanisciuri TaxID=2973940 RepID=A0ABT2EZF8_9STAP|nr:hypothetical protein [Staphylococcus americanisciuri]MCS4485603.1 hypothetical protein [Staphylococcus americanisciuri]
MNLKSFNGKLGAALFSIGLTIASSALLFGAAHNAHAAEYSYLHPSIPSNAVAVADEPGVVKVIEGNVTTYYDAKTGEVVAQFSSKPRG